MRTPEEQKTIDDVTKDHIGTQLDIDTWGGAFLIGGAFMFILGVMLFVGKCLAYFVSYLI